MDLSNRELGIYALMNSFFQLCIIVPNYSVNATIVRFYSEYKSSFKKFKKYMDLLMLKIITIFVFLIIVIMFLYNRYSLTFNTFDILTIIIIFVSFLLFRNAISYLQAMNKKKTFLMVGMFELGLRFVLTIIFLKINFSYYAPFWAMIFSSLISLLIIKILKNSDFSTDTKKEEDFTQISSYFKPMILSAIFMWILSSSDQYMIDIYMGKEETGIYLKYYVVPFQIIILFTTAYMMFYEPHMSSLFSSRKVNEIKKEKRTALKYMSVYTIPTFILGTLLSGYLYTILYRELVPNYKMLYLFISIGAIFWSYYKIFNYLILLDNKSTISSFFLGISSLSNIIFNIILLPKFGIIGAATSTMLSYAFLFLLSYCYVKFYIERNIK